MKEDGPAALRPSERRELLDGDVGVHPHADVPFEVADQGVVTGLEVDGQRVRLAPGQLPDLIDAV